MNRLPRKIMDQLPDDGNRGVLLIGDTKKNFEFRVILVAEARVILVCLAVKTINRFQDADGRSEIRGKRATRGSPAKKSPRRDDRGDVVSEGSKRNQQERPANRSPRHHVTSLGPSIPSSRRCTRAERRATAAASLFLRGRAHRRTLRPHSSAP